jgi:enediyne biosynthesis protein E4
MQHNPLPPRMYPLFLASAAALLMGSAHAQFGAFSDQTALTGINAAYGSSQPSFTGGGTVGDFNRDGWQDVFYPAGTNGPDQLWINNGDGTFTDQAAAWGIALTHRSSAAAVGDYNNDGWLDIFVTSHGPTGASQPGFHKLYRNTGSGTFVDEAVAAGVNTTNTSTGDGWGSCFGDIDLDGDLDLVVAGWFGPGGNRLFENNGNGTFTDVTVAAGLVSMVDDSGFAPRLCDMDGDRYPELIMISDFSTSEYFVNNQDGTFTEFTIGSGTSQDGTEMGATIADFDEDGDWDIYVTTISTNNLYVNQGANIFQNEANLNGTADTGWGWGSVSFDMDHDSHIDLFATAQNGRSYAFHNDSQTPLSFSEEALSNGLGLPLDGRGMSRFDYDNDGDQDIIVFTFAGTVRVFRNDLTGPDKHWLRVFLDPGEVTDIAPDGIGSVVKLTFGGRTIMGRIDGGSNYLSMSEMSAHFGLGTATVVDEVRVEWTNGDVTILNDIAADQTMTIAPPNANMYCPPLMNAAGTFSKMIPTGTPIVGNNDFGLFASDLPTNEFGIFIMGPNQATIPLFAGTLCVNTPFVRVLPIVTTGATGTVNRPIDINEPLLAGGIMPGAQLNFQLWHRDGVVNQANLTNGVEVWFE